MSDDIPQWMKELNLRPRQQEIGRPVPPISGSVKVDREVDPVASAKLDQDFRMVIETCSQSDEYQINQRILDAVTGNRLTSVQGRRLLFSLFAKFDGGPGCQRVKADGDTESFDRWGAA